MIAREASGGTSPVEAVTAAIPRVRLATVSATSLKKSDPSLAGITGVVTGARPECIETVIGPSRAAAPSWTETKAPFSKAVTRTRYRRPAASTVDSEWPCAPKAPMPLSLAPRRRP